MRRIIYTCDKCGREELVKLPKGMKEPKILYSILYKEVCEKCVLEIESSDKKKND